MNCPYCLQPATVARSDLIVCDVPGLTGKDTAQISRICFDEPVQHMVCANKHSFYAKTEAEAEREAEDAKAAEAWDPPN